MKPDCQIVEIDISTLKKYIKDIISVRTSAYEEWNGPKSQQEQQEEAEFWLRKISARPNSAAFIAQKDNEIIGYICGYERDEGNFYISHIGIRQEFKRQGIGRALLRKCEEVCRACGYHVLSTITQNRFRGMLILLIKEGFYIEGTALITGASELRILLRKEIR